MTGADAEWQVLKTMDDKPEEVPEYFNNTECKGIDDDEEETSEGIVINKVFSKIIQSVF